MIVTAEYVQGIVNTFDIDRLHWDPDIPCDAEGIAATVNATDWGTQAAVTVDSKCTFEKWDGTSNVTNPYGELVSAAAYRAYLIKNKWWNGEGFIVRQVVEGRTGRVICRDTDGNSMNSARADEVAIIKRQNEIDNEERVLILAAIKAAYEGV